MKQTQSQMFADSRSTYCNLLLIALFLLAPLYFQPNLGGIGLNLTYNIPAWAIVSFLINGSLYLMASTQRFIHPRHSWALLVFPVVMILSGIAAGSSQPIPWFFRQIYILGGILFLFALFQFNIKQRQVERLLYVVVASAFINTLVAITQIFSPELIREWLATAGNIPLGTFQQVNVLSSYLATGIIISFYLISRPSITSASLAAKVLLIVCIGSSAFIITYIGSRSGMLSTVIGILILLACRRQQLKKRAVLTLVGLLSLLAGAIPGGTVQGVSGFERLSQKTIEITEGVDASIRINMYTIALELVAQKPLFGHGIGNFQRVWGLQSGDYHQRNPNAKLPPYITHPHNELVYWLIEGGIVSFTGIIIAIGVIIFALIRCGSQRGGGYAALLIPISLHAQVELPFYLSSLHWFLWLFLIFLILRHRIIISTVPLSRSATQLIKATAILACIGSSYFMIHTARAQTDIYAYLTQKKDSAPYLQVALNNLYFKSYAEQLAMRNMLHSSIRDKKTDKVRYFTQWAEQKISINPELKLFEDLINAYTFLKLEQERCKTIHTGTMMYPMNQPLKTIADSCKKSH